MFTKCAFFKKKYVTSTQLVACERDTNSEVASARADGNAANATIHNK